MYRNPDLKEETIPSVEKLQSALQHEVEKHRYWHFLEGILFLVVGILAIAMPVVSTMTVELVAATALSIGGVMRLINSFRFQTGRRWRLLSGVVFLAAGAAMLWWPHGGVWLALIIVTGAFLFAEGVH